jgi:bacillithiol biosynthesis deacetylase BshB1
MDAFDIAAVCAHPDDAELVMGGTIAREAARGRRVAIVDLTRGESGSRGTPETRAAEADAAARILGVAHRESLGLPDARLSVVPEHKDPLVEAIRRLRPRVVLLQHWEQRHPDHANASRIVYEASFLAGLRNYRSDLGPAFRPTKLVYALRVTEASEGRPTLVVDGLLGDEAPGDRGLRQPVHAGGGRAGPPRPRPLPRRRGDLGTAPRPEDRRPVRRGLRHPRAAGRGRSPRPRRLVVLSPDHSRGRPARRANDPIWSLPRRGS